MKRGILELVDVIAVNKADEQHESESERAARDLSAALRLLRGPRDEWQPPVVTCSARHNTNLDRVWKHVERHQDWLAGHGGLAAKRRDQMVDWTRALVADRLLSRLDAPRVRAAVRSAEDEVRAERLTPDQAASGILAELDAADAASAGDAADPRGGHDESHDTSHHARRAR